MRTSFTGCAALTATLTLAQLGFAQEEAPVDEAASEESGASEPAADEGDAEEASDEEPAREEKEDEEDEDKPDSDERTANNAIYLELLGPGGIYSLNYDRAIGDVGLRIGFSYISVSATATSTTGTTSASATFITVPLTASYLGLGSKTHMFEVGGGMTFMFLGAGADGFYGSEEADANASVFLPVGTVLAGYRLQPKDGGFLFRIGASPLVGPGGFLPWGYLALGGTF